MFLFLFQTRPYFVLLGRSGKTPPQSCGLSLRDLGRPAKIFTRHAIRSPHREPGSFSGQTQTLLPASRRRYLLPARCRRYFPRYTFSAARIFALRDRGLRSISSSVAVTGFFVSSRYQPCLAPSRSASLTIRSSSEWKLITTSLPPGFSTRGAA